MKYLILIVLLILPIVNAELIVTPLELDVTTTVNQESIVDLELKNNYDFKITDINFTELREYGFSIPPEISLEPNETRTIQLTVNPSDSVHETINSIISFNYYIEISNMPETRTVTINESGIFPQHIDMRNQDTIIWKNEDTISHTLFSPKFIGGEHVILSNSTAQQTFMEVDEVSYYDPDWFEFFNFHGTINIVNRTMREKANNPNYDVALTVNYNSILSSTNLTIETSDNSFEIEHKTFKKGLLTIENIGTELADIITLSSSSNWVTFDEQDFNINPGEKEFVEFTITPQLLDTNETDKNYAIDITAKSTNSDLVTITINVFIPYSEVTTSLDGSDVDVLNWLDNVYCPSHPSSFLCDPELANQTNDNITYQDIELPINVSALTFYDMKREIGLIKDSQIRNDNLEKLKAEEDKIKLAYITEKVNETNRVALETQKKERTRNNLTWILGFFILLFVIAYFMFKRANKIAYLNNLMEGAYEYRK